MLTEDVAKLVIETVIGNIFEELFGKISFEIKKNQFLKNIEGKMEKLLKEYGDETFLLSVNDYLLNNDVIKKMIWLCNDYVKMESRIEILQYAEDFYEKNKSQIEYFSIVYIKLFFAKLLEIIFEARYSIKEYSNEEAVVAYTKKYFNDIDDKLELNIKEIKNDINQISKNLNKNNLIANDKKFMFLEMYENKLFLEDDNNVLTLKDVYMAPRFKVEGKIHTNIESYIEEFMFSQNEDNILLIVGQPSIGKSSLIADLVYKFKYREDIIALPMKNFDGKESLLNGLRKELRCNDNDLENKILILDGYDETKVVKEKDANINKICLDFINDLQALTVKDNSLKVIMTIRTEFFDLKEWKEKYENVCVIEILDFDKKQIKEFIKNYSQKKKKPSILNSKLIRKSLSEKKFGIIANPMMLYMICYYGGKLGNRLEKELIFEKIFSKNGSLFTNMYKGKGQAEDKDTIEKYYKIIEGIAFEMFRNSLSNLSGKEYFKYIKDNNLKQFAGMTINMTDGDEDIKVEFRHESIYHYFIAEYIYMCLSQICDVKDVKNDDVLKMVDNLFSSINIDNETFEFLKYFIRTRELVFLENKNHVLVNSMEYVLKKNCIYTLNSENTNIILLDRIHNAFGNYWRVFIEIYFIISKNNKTDFILLEIIKDKGVWKSISRLVKNGSFVKLCFRGANFEDGDLRGAILRDSDFSFANLRNIDLRGASLLGAKFNNANLENANLNGADLCRAKFKNASLRRLKLRGSILKECDFKKSKDISALKFSYSNIMHVKGITESDLENCFVYNEHGKMLPYREFNSEKNVV